MKTENKNSLLTDLKSTLDLNIIIKHYFLKSKF